MKMIRIMRGREFKKEAANSRQSSCGHDGSLDFYLADSMIGPPRISRRGSTARLDQFGEVNQVVVHLEE